jgi:hypothetical protein
MSQTEPTVVQPTTDVPQLAGNLWWDDVRLGARLLFAGFLVILVPLLGRHALVSGLYYVLLIVAAGLLLVGLKMCISVPAETGARMYVYGAVGALKLAVLALIVFLIMGTLGQTEGLLLAALGMLGNILIALFVRNTAQYLRAQSLALLAMQYTMLAAVVSVAAVVASIMHADALVNLLTLLLIGVQIFLVGHLHKAIVNVQHGLAAEARTTQPSGIEAAAEAAAHTVDHEPLPVVHAPYFTDKQWEVLETSDRSAGRAVISLMTAIFLIGVLLYSIIAAWAMMSA